MQRLRDMKIRQRANIKLARNLIVFIALIIFTFWFLLKDQDLNELNAAIHSANPVYILLAILCMAMVYTMESINVRAVLVALGEKKFSIFTALKYTMIGNFFSAITPAATGGQPVEIYYMSKDGIKGPNGTLAMLLQLCGFQISTLLMSFICGILNPSLLADGLVWFYILGLVLNGCALTLMLIGTFSEKMANKFCQWAIKGIKKAKLKNVEKRQANLEKGLAQYAESAKFIKSHKNEFIKSIIRVTIQIIFYHSIPYCIYKAFGLQELSYFQVFSMQAILFTTVSAIPLPGSIGISETLFLKLYGMAFGRELLSGAMLLYRFCSFYLFIAFDAVIVVITAVRTKNIESEIDKAVKEVEKEEPKKGKSKLAYN